MMTRETKAGLVVSCSFLCLVGVVLYCKMNGPKPPPADLYAEGVEAPPAPTAVDETNQSNDHVLPFGSDSSGSSSSQVTSNVDGKSNQSSFGNNDVPAPQTMKNAAEGPAFPDQASNGDYASNSASKTETASQDKKNTSASSTSIYAIPDPVDEDKTAAKTAKSSESENKIAKTGATLDPIQDVKDTKEAKETADKDQQDTSKASWVIPPEEPSKDKSSDLAKIDSTKTNAAAPVDLNTGHGQKDKDNTGSLNGDKKPSDQKVTPEQEPPPIPKGLHDPFQSLPEPPPASTSPAAAANKSPRDAGLRKTTTTPAAGKAANSGRTITGVTASPSRGDLSQSSATISAPSTPLVTQAGGSSPSNGFDNSSTSVATNSNTGRSLAPGVMPSPRTLALPPAGDTAPEPNVRLGPPTGSAGETRMEDRGSRIEKSAMDSANPQTSTVDPRSSLPPSDQLAQGPSPTISGPGTAPPYQTPGLAAGTITSPGRTPATQVDSYDEETHLCKAGDTFAAISMKYYQTEKYAQALLLFNRNHPRATAGVRQDPPSLAAGQPVFIPPLRVLEKRYATAISDLASGVGGQGSGIRGQESGIRGQESGVRGQESGIRSQESGIKSQDTAIPGAQVNSDTGNSPLPAAPTEVPNNTGGANYAIPDGRAPAPSLAPGTLPGTLPGKTTPPKNERSYVVPKSGETLWEISRHTLGNPNRWSEISRLNPQIDPKYPVAGGMTLRMPADARIDPPSPTTAEGR